MLWELVKPAAFPCSNNWIHYYVPLVCRVVLSLILFHLVGVLVFHLQIKKQRLREVEGLNNLQLLHSWNVEELQIVSSCKWHFETGFISISLGMGEVYRDFRSKPQSLRSNGHILKVKLCSWQLFSLILIPEMGITMTFLVYILLCSCYAHIRSYNVRLTT